MLGLGGSATCPLQVCDVLSALLASPARCHSHTPMTTHTHTHTSQRACFQALSCGHAQSGPKERNAGCEHPDKEQHLWRVGLKFLFGFFLSATTSAPL